MPGVTFLLQNYVSYAEINHYFFSKNQNKMERNNIIEKKQCADRAEYLNIGVA